MRRFADIRREDGQALVEFALVLPILLMVATGITSFGLVFYHYITIEDAVRSGARTLSLGRGNTAPSPNDPCTLAINETFNSAVDAGLTSNKVTLIVDGQQMFRGAPARAHRWTPGQPGDRDRHGPLHHQHRRLESLVPRREHHSAGDGCRRMTAA